mmetsp:Transcript_10336/g.10335  ORF Transcript_10336/g.10335 Transcript_10336/m.10335 type:complete len:542 (-) Transcript_10336:749-2374(-)
MELLQNELRVLSLRRPLALTRLLLIVVCGLFHLVEVFLHFLGDIIQVELVGDLVLHALEEGFGSAPRVQSGVLLRIRIRRVMPLPMGVYGVILGVELLRGLRSIQLKVLILEVRHLHGFSLQELIGIFPQRRCLLAFDLAPALLARVIMGDSVLEVLFLDVFVEQDGGSLLFLVFAIMVGSFLGVDAGLLAEHFEVLFLGVHVHLLHADELLHDLVRGEGLLELRLLLQHLNHLLRERLFEVHQGHYDLLQILDVQDHLVLETLHRLHRHIELSQQKRLVRCVHIANLVTQPLILNQQPGELGVLVGVDHLSAELLALLGEGSQLLAHLLVLAPDLLHHPTHSRGEGLLIISELLGDGLELVGVLFGELAEAQVVPFLGVKDPGDLIDHQRERIRVLQALLWEGGRDLKRLSVLLEGSIGTAEVLMELLLGAQELCEERAQASLDLHLVVRDSVEELLGVADGGGVRLDRLEGDGGPSEVDDFLLGHDHAHLVALLLGLLPLPQELLHLQDLLLDDGGLLREHLLQGLEVLPLLLDERVHP